MIFLYFFSAYTVEENRCLVCLCSKICTFEDSAVLCENANFKVISKTKVTVSFTSDSIQKLNFDPRKVEFHLTTSPFIPGRLKLRVNHVILKLSIMNHYLIIISFVGFGMLTCCCLDSNYTLAYFYNITRSPWRAQ